MNPKLRENLRLGILTALEASKPYAVSQDALCIALVSSGYRDVADLRAELEYLLEKSFVSKSARRISPEIDLWQITAQGRDFLAVEGLA